MSNSPRIMYVQVRHGEVREHELHCLEKSLGLSRDHFTTINVFDRLPKVEELRDHQALIMGGSGDYWVSKGDIKKEVDACAKLFKAAYETRMPTLAICFGAHVMTYALGGTVENSNKRKETGTFEIELHENTFADPLFRSLPQYMWVQQGHSDGFARLPSGAIPLARSLRWPCQAYLMAGTPMYAIQFHPELSAEDIVFRLNMYRAAYVASDDHFDELIKSLRPTPEASTIPRMFIEQFVERTRAIEEHEVPIYSTQ